MTELNRKTEVMEINVTFYWPIYQCRACLPGWYYLCLWRWSLTFITQTLSINRIERGCIGMQNIHPYRHILNLSRIKLFFHNLKENIVVPQLKFDYIILNKDIKLFEISYEHFVDFIITWTHSIKLNKLLLYIGYTCFLLLFSTPLWRLRRIFI